MTFHHVGYACRDLDAELAGLSVLGYSAVEARFEDPGQGVAGLFCEDAAGGPRIELLAPLPGCDVLDPWLRGPAKLYHLAYEVPEIEPAIDRATREGARLVRPPVPAVAFDGRPIAFLMLPTRLLVEYVGLAR